MTTRPMLFALRVASFLAAGATATAAQADTFAGKTVQMIIGFGAMLKM